MDEAKNRAVSTISSKKAVRNALREQRQGLTAELVASHSKSIFEHVIQFEPFSMAQTVALYLPIDNEVDTSFLITHLNTFGKMLCLPVVEPGRMLGFGLYSPGDPLRQGSFGISEPLSREWVDISSIDLMFLPLVGFDPNGTRLGYGGGYYDRVLSGLETGKAQPVLAGLAFELQENAQLPCAAHDVPLQYVVTERGVRSFVRDT